MVHAIYCWLDELTSNNDERVTHRNIPELLRDVLCPVG